MSGVTIVGTLLQADSTMTAIVPAEWIVAWTLPQGAPANAVVVERVSRTEWQPLAGEPVRRATERVQINIRAASGRERGIIEKAARHAVADRIGTIADYAGVSVLLAGGGPDFMDDDASIFLTSFDVQVSFLEPA